MSNTDTEKLKSGYERRLYPRFQIGSTVSIHHGSFGILMARTVDISDGGMQVRLEDGRKIPEGSHLQVNMLNSANPNISFNMKVIRSQDDILGMQFIDCEYEGQRHNINELFSGLSIEKK
ncbi:MAG: PilZ domain-containing protein [Gammaproteobacteria bacterium]|nr:PilZ domain-containing protein [Gammaproteobacteria bacterium]